MSLHAEEIGSRIEIELESEHVGMCGEFQRLGRGKKGSDVFAFYSALNFKLEIQNVFTSLSCVGSGGVR